MAQKAHYMEMLVNNFKVSIRFPSLLATRNRIKINEIKISFRRRHGNKNKNKNEIYIHLRITR